MTENYQSPLAQPSSRPANDSNLPDTLLSATLDDDGSRLDEEAGTLKEQSISKNTSPPHAEQHRRGDATSQNGSEEHETELRDLLIRALERNGVLSDLRAQLRSSVYTIIEQERQKLSPVNNGLTVMQQGIVDSLPNRISLALVRDFLHKLPLPYTRRLLEVELALDEIDMDPNSSVFLPEFGLPDTLEPPTKAPAVPSPSHATPNHATLPHSSSANSTPQLTDQHASTQNLTGMPILSRLVQAQCLSRHRHSIEAEFRSFLATRTKLRTESDIINCLFEFSATRHMKNDVLEAYVGSVLDNPLYSRLEASESAMLILKQICIDSSEVLSAETIFNNPPTHERLISYQPRNYTPYTQRSTTASSANGDSDVHNLSNSLNSSTLNEHSVTDRSLGDR